MAIVPDATDCGDGLLASLRPLADAAGACEAPSVTVTTGLADCRPERGGLDPSVPTVLTKWQVTGRLMVGHTTDFADESVPIIVREADIVLPPASGVGYAEGRCRRCVAKPFLALGEDETVMVLQHQPGCREMGGAAAAGGGGTVMSGMPPPGGISWDELPCDGPMCEQVSPGTEDAWMPSVCEKPPGHEGRHTGQYDERWDDEGNTDLADCIPYYNDDPVLPHPEGFHPGPVPSAPCCWPDGHPDEAVWQAGPGGAGELS